MNLTKFSRPFSHFEIIFEREEGKRGIPLYQTLSIVSHYITLHHIVSVTAYIFLGFTRVFLGFTRVNPKCIDDYVVLE